MVAVDTGGGIRYGFGLLGYLIVVFVTGGLLAWIGATLTTDSPVLGGLLAIGGFATLTAGSFGLLYKVIADGVEAGTVAAKRGSPAHSREERGGRGSE